MSRKIVSGGKYLILSVNSGKLLRVENDSIKDDSRIVQWDPMDRDVKTRVWRMERLSDGSMKLRNEKTGKYLTVKTDSKQNRVELVQRKKDDSTKQRFRIVTTKENDIRIEMEDEANDLMKLLDDRRDRDERRDLDTRIDERELRDLRRDREDRMIDDKDRRDRLNKERTIRVLDIEGSSHRNGARLVQWKMTGEKNQRFKLISMDKSSKL